MNRHRAAFHWFQFSSLQTRFVENRGEFLHSFFNFVPRIRLHTGCANNFFGLHRAGKIFWNNFQSLECFPTEQNVIVVQIWGYQGRNFGSLAAITYFKGSGTSADHALVAGVPNLFFLLQVDEHPVCLRQIFRDDGLGASCVGEDLL